MLKACLRTLLLWLLIAAMVVEGQGLPSLHLRKDTITLSGFDSGGFMATQFEFAFAHFIRGVGVAGAGPYLCAQSSLAVATLCMTVPLTIDVSYLEGLASVEADNGLIDALTNISTHTVTLFSGGRL